MPGYQRFEETEIWKSARELAKGVYALTRQPSFARDKILCDQIRRAAISVSSNIAEGYERGGKAEFRTFLSIAKGSAGEVRSQLYLAFDQGYIEQGDFEAMQALCQSTGRQISGFMKYLRK